MDFHPTVYLNKLQVHGNRNQAVKYRRRRLELFDSLYYQNLCAHYGCVNALEFSRNAGRYLASGGDDKRVLLWDLGRATQQPTYRPIQMKATHLSNIFCYAFDQNDDNLISSGNDGQIIVHDLSTAVLADVFVCDASVYGLSANPVNKHQIAAACEDGTIHIMDTRLPKGDGMCLARRYTAFHSVMFSPVDQHLIATSHSWDGMALWDIRSPKKEVLHYDEKHTKQRAMSARFNSTGNQLLLLRRRQPMALFNINQSTSIWQFDSEGYSNSCTMKSCCFAGDKDQYIVSGSDDFGVYMWKIPECSGDSVRPRLISKPSKMLLGHRSIVNQVRFNSHSNVLVSCGVEKMVKLWCTERLPYGAGSTTSGTQEPRKRYSHHEYIGLILESSSMIHDYHTENTEEDPKMLAFFDSLMQHEADARNSETSDEETAAIAQRNHRFVTVAGDLDRDSSSEDLDSDEIGPATLEVLGLHGAETRVNVSADVQNRIRRLRATVNDEDNWRMPNVTPTTPPTVSENYSQEITTPKKKRRKKDAVTTQQQISGSSSSEDEATRIRQLNACRRPRKLYRARSHVQCEDDSAPSTSGLNSRSDSDSKVFDKNIDERS